MEVNEKRKTTIKGSYFPGEEYEFESASDKLVLFVEMLKSRGCYISEDGHIRSKNGGMMSKLMRNGYYLTMAQYNKKCYYFCEHRVVWVWYNGAIPKGKEINHRDNHPCQKPIALYAWILNNYAKQGDRILDTHLGSGSSAIAAWELGYEFVGIEIDSEYYNNAVERIKRHTAQGKLF